MDVQFHCVIEKGFSWSRKKKSFSHTASLTQYEWNIERELKLTKMTLKLTTNIKIKMENIKIKTINKN